MCFQLYGTLDNLFVYRMSDAVLNRHNNGFIHFIAYYLADRSLSHIPVVHSLLLPSVTLVHRP